MNLIINIRYYLALNVVPLQFNNLFCVVFKTYVAFRVHVFHDMIVDMLSNKKLNPIVNVSFIRGRKVYSSIGFIRQSYLAVPKNIRLNATLYFVMKVLNKRDLQQIAFNHA